MEFVITVITAILIYFLQRIVALNIPVIGVNLGRIGYMAELDVNEDSLISEFFKGNFYSQP